MVGLILRARVGEKGQVVIPKPIRDQFAITPQSDVDFTVEDNQIVIQKKDPEQLYQDLIFNPSRKKMPKNIDWDAMYYSQFDK